MQSGIETLATPDIKTLIRLKNGVRAQFKKGVDKVDLAWVAESATPEYLAKVRDYLVGQGYLVESSAKVSVITTPPEFYAFNPQNVSLSVREKGGQHA